MGARYDLLVRNATVIDGTRAPRFEADLGVRGDRVERIGDLAGATAALEDKSYGPGPVTVHTSKPASPKTTKAAINRWNSQAGFKVFKATSNPKKADIKVRAAQKLKKSWATGGRGRVNVSSIGAANARKPADPGTKAMMARVYQHELGHAIGLAHPAGNATRTWRRLPSASVRVASWERVAGRPRMTWMSSRPSAGK